MVETANGVLVNHCPSSVGPVVEPAPRWVPMKGFLVLRALGVVCLGATNGSLRMAGEGGCGGRIGNVAEVGLHTVSLQICCIVHSWPARRCYKQSFPQKNIHAPLTLPFISPAWSSSEWVAETPLYTKAGKPHPRFRVKLITGEVGMAHRPPMFLRKRIAASDFIQRPYVLSVCQTVIH